MTFPTSQNFVSFIILLVLLVSCQKAHDPSRPPIYEMDYVDLNDQEIKDKSRPAVLDLDMDQKPDLIFGILLVGDPVNQLDKTQYRVTSGIYTRLPVNYLEQVPKLSRGDMIPLHNFNGHQWYEVSSVVLAERIENIAGTIRWNGNWQNATKNFLPIQLIKNNQRFNGWIELTFDLVNEKIILHRAATSKHPEKDIRAGI